MGETGYTEGTLEFTRENGVHKGNPAPTTSINKPNLYHKDTENDTICTCDKIKKTGYLPVTMVLPVVIL